ncbi:MAG: type III-B CRISPR module-associated protein Cmr5 [Chloroflexi bacterium CFX1]|nr:type III-B CRISPR module-associated protein Cmr5 [Chloroflexi bacterium CFX1]MCK6584587.1 type III-B CRISPR module-associated protein Cmr5 [Anaerolineales bacterium]MCQ3952977.1 type III-B CRISPR module-associated protein Cmr5 [Chloroflexota bacterium]MDL1919490.1 type III-B CRISPR module-associated protein Cmr5 [Chloroflexi bacterium CFX5]
MKTLDQILAEAAYHKVAAFGDEHKKGTTERKQYGSMAHKLPILVRTAGLAEAISFVESRGKDGHKVLLKDLGEIVLEGNGGNFAEESRSAEMQKYMYLTRRTLLALKWFKRFAESVLEVKATEEGEIHD